jgi:hypothetical protein
MFFLRRLTGSLIPVLFPEVLSEFRAVISFVGIVFALELLFYVLQLICVQLHIAVGFKYAQNYLYQNTEIIIIII